MPVPPFEKAKSKLTLEEVVQLTALCTEVSSDWRAPEESRWKAILWSNRQGEHVVGQGPTALDAVLSAHRGAK